MFFMGVNYSQNNEQELITEFFKGATPGRFLDIGAYNGKDFSNTLRLVELGWGGVCIEPSPTVFKSLLDLHGGNSEVVLINAAVGPYSELVEFHDSSGDALSTTDAGHREKWHSGLGVVYKTFWVYTVPIGEILHVFGTGFAFINLDVESTNFKLFSALPLRELTATKLICVEHDGQEEGITAIAKEHGFEKLAINGENLLLCRR
jgi:FkbM family methyltransferase